MVHLKNLLPIEFAKLLHIKNPLPIEFAKLLRAPVYLRCTGVVFNFRVCAIVFVRSSLVSCYTILVYFVDNEDHSVTVNRENDLM